MSVNKVILVGNLGRDPETRFTTSGSAVTNAALATSKSWKSKESGQMQEETEWHRLVFFNRLAEIAGEYLKKGAKIYVEGSLKTNKYTGKDGTEKYSTEIIVREMQMLGNKEGQRQEQDEYNKAQVTQVDNNQNDFDEDIPF